MTSNKLIVTECRKVHTVRNMQFLNALVTHSRWFSEDTNLLKWLINRRTVTKLNIIDCHN